MAAPISRTPILKKDEAENFYKSVEENLDKPSYPKCNSETIKKARESLKRYVSKQRQEYS